MCTCTPTQNLCESLGTNLECCKQLHFMWSPILSVSKHSYKREFTMWKASVQANALPKMKYTWWTKIYGIQFYVCITITCYDQVAKTRQLRFFFLNLFHFNAFSMHFKMSLFEFWKQFLFKVSFIVLEICSFWIHINGKLFQFSLNTYIK